MIATQPPDAKYILLILTASIKTFSPAESDYKVILAESNPDDWIFADGIGINIAVDMLGYPKMKCKWY